MRAGVAAIACAVLSACSSVDGALLHARPRDDGRSIDDAGDAPIAIAQDMSWQYQLTGALRLDDDDVELFVIDLFAPERSQLAALHAAGKIAVAYLSAGTFEPFRADAGSFPRRAIGNTLADYPDEAWLDIRDATVRELMAARLDVARAVGFDGVLPTNLSGYLTDTGFDLSADDQRAYSAWLADEAHARGLAIGMAGDFEQAPELIDRFDWAVHFGCIERGDCDDLAPFVARGKPVLDIETEGDPAGVCAAGEQLGLNVLLKRAQFDAYRVGCL